MSKNRPEDLLYQEFRQKRRKKTLLGVGAVLLFFAAFAIFALPNFLRKTPGDYTVEEVKEEKRWRPDQAADVKSKPLEMNDALANRIEEAEKEEEPIETPEKRTGEPIDPTADPKQAISFQGVFDPETEEGQRLSEKADALLKLWSEADTTQELRKLVVEPERVVPLILDYRERSEVVPVVFGKLLQRSYFKIRGARYLIQTHHPESEKGQPLFVALRVMDDGKLRMDWESLVGYSEMEWADFVAKRPTTGTTFRCFAGPSDYYNFEFADRTKFVSIMLSDRSSEHVFYGFAERDGEIAKQLGKAFSMRVPSPVVVKLAFTEGSKADRCVRLVDFIQETWILENAGK